MDDLRPSDAETQFGLWTAECWRTADLVARERHNSWTVKLASSDEDTSVIRGEGEEGMLAAVPAGRDRKGVQRLRGVRRERSRKHRAGTDARADVVRAKVNP